MASQGPEGPPRVTGGQGPDDSLLSRAFFRKRKGDEVDGMDEVAKKKSKKEKDKESRLEKALKVSSRPGPGRCCRSCCFRGHSCPRLTRRWWQHRRVEPGRLGQVLGVVSLYWLH